ncbi:hypothetical protein QYZ88_000020 [Lachnospiraceae bacterium C1.1]
MAEINILQLHICSWQMTMYGNGELRIGRKSQQDTGNRVMYRYP